MLAQNYIRKGNQSADILSMERVNYIISDSFSSHFCTAGVSQDKMAGLRERGNKAKQGFSSSESTVKADIHPYN
jgi:hypothetical protein